MGTLPHQHSWTERLRASIAENKLQKTAKQLIMTQMKEEEMKASREIFVKLDLNNDGLVTLPELAEGLRQAGVYLNPLDLQEVIDAVDVDVNGKLDYTELLTGAHGCVHAFQALDLDDKGKILQQDLNHNLQCTSAQDGTIHDVFKEVDANGDGCIDYDKFTATVRDPASNQEFIA